MVSTNQTHEVQQTKYKQDSLGWSNSLPRVPIKHDDVPYVTSKWPEGSGNRLWILWPLGGMAFQLLRSWFSFLAGMRSQLWCVTGDAFQVSSEKLVDDVLSLSIARFVVCIIWIYLTCITIYIQIYTLHDECRGQQKLNPTHDQQVPTYSCFHDSGQLWWSFQGVPFLAPPKNVGDHLHFPYWRGIPLVISHSHWIWPFLVDLPITDGWCFP